MEKGKMLSKGCKMKLVKFNDGTFGVRRGWFFYQFADKQDQFYWWSKTENVEEYSKCTEERAREILARLKFNPLKHEVIQ